MAAAQIKDIFSKPDGQRKECYQKLADQWINEKNIAGLQELSTHLVKTEGSQQFGRTYITSDVMSHIFTRIADTESKNSLSVEEMTPLLVHAVEVLRTVQDTFADALMKGVKLLSECYQAEGEFKKAAFALASFKFDKSSATAEQKVDWFVDTAEFWLEVNESGPASQQVTRAHMLLQEVKHNAELVLRFKTVQARVLDAERKFLRASMLYHELSQMTHLIKSEADIIQTLEFAVTTAILSQPGPQRSRQLATLYADERTKNLPNFGMLEKMFKERIVRTQEIEQFEKLLQEHQNAQTSSGNTVLLNSMIEHNMFATSKIYNNIRFDELGRLLGIPAKQAEALASSMIEQGRMHGVIDQVEGIVEFESASGGSGPLATWDASIQDLCLVLNGTVDHIASKHPQYKL